MARRSFLRQLVALRITSELPVNCPQYRRLNSQHDVQILLWVTSRLFMPAFSTFSGRLEIVQVILRRHQTWMV
jgi:hypothetical protein